MGINPAMQAAAPTGSSSNWFDPKWGRLSFAALIATLGFLLPQEIPLEWYPLDNPGTDLNYLEIACAANVTGEVKILYDLGQHGHQPIDTIRWPISPTSQTYTYTFPLPDAPIVEMRVIPPVGGELTIRQMRIINRRDEELRRFTYDLFRAERDIAAISPSPDGWKLIATTKGIAPSTRIELYSPIVPVGKDHRNLLRCLLSTGYLSMMLWILLLAVLFVFYRPHNWRDLAFHLGFMACLAVMFSLVGNRGLVRNSINYARYVAPAIPSDLKLEFDLVSSGPSVAQLFWDTGQGFNETESIRRNHEPHPGQQTVRFPLPNRPIKSLRFDPRDNPGTVLIRGIRLIDAGQRTHAVLPLDSLRPERDITKLDLGEDGLHIETTPVGRDPNTSFSAAALELINRTLTRPVNP
jgi:hypothetical protein